MYKYAYITTLSQSTEHVCMHTLHVLTQTYMQTHMYAQMYITWLMNQHTTNKFIRMYV